MSGYMKRRKVRSDSTVLDLMHIVIGLAVVAMAVVSFINPEENLILFPVIFFLAAFLNLVTGRFKLKRGKDRARKAGAVAQILFGAAFLVLTVVSAVSIWR